MPISTPQSQAGVLSFYDAPEHGPSLNPKLILIGVSILVVIVLIFDHASLA